MDNNAASSSNKAYESVSIDMEGGKADSDDPASSASLSKVKVGQPLAETSGRANNHADHKPALGSSNSCPGSRASRGNILSSLLARQRSTPASSTTPVNRRLQQSRSVTPPSNAENPSAASNTWRVHLNEIFSVSTPPSNEALLSIIQCSNMRYQALAARAENQETNGNSSNLEGIILRDGDTEQAQPNANSSNTSASPTLATNPFHDVGAVSAAPSPGRRESHVNDSNHDQNGAQDDRDAVWFITKIWPYLPILLLLLLKFIYDNSISILNFVLLQFEMLILNEIVRREMMKFIRESVGKLISLSILCGVIITLCLCLAEAPPDPFGLIMPPPARHENIQGFTSALESKLSRYETKDNDPGENLQKPKEESIKIKETLESKYGTKSGEMPTYQEKQNIDEKSETGNTKADKNPESSNQGKSIQRRAVKESLERKAIPLGTMLFYIAISDLLIRIITIFIKCLVTMFLRKSVRKKRLLRMYVFIEYLSQFYRCFTPYTQWMSYLDESYAKDENIIRISFCIFYTLIKFLEIVQRGAFLKKATQSVFSKIHPERTPTKEELDAAGTDCPICHDTYNSPIIVECGHIFCEDCVQTWFTREQTCPMCRAKVNDDPAYQDGGTTYTFQLY